MRGNTSRYVLLGLVSLSIIVIDQVTKVYIMQTMRLHESIVVIPNLFSITYIRNPGAAFGILSGSSGSFRFIFLGQHIDRIYTLTALGAAGSHTGDVNVRHCLERQSVGCIDISSWDSKCAGRVE